MTVDASDAPKTGERVGDIWVREEVPLDPSKLSGGTSEELGTGVTVTVTVWRGAA